MKVKIVTALAFAIASLALTGCETPKQTIAANYQEKPGTIDFALADRRPVDEAKQELLSRMPGSCSTGVLRLADDVTRPSRMVILQQDLETSFGTALKNKIVTVTHYRIYFNTHESLANGNKAFDSGLLGHGLTSAMAGSECTKDNTAPGSYLISEAELPYSPFIIEIALEVDGRTYSQRTVYTPKENLPFRLSSDYSSVALLEAIHRAHGGVIEKLRSEIAKP